jgi:hypothetical protein
MDWSGLSVALGFPLLRAVLGWLRNAIEDNVIDVPEWTQFANTVIRVGVPAFFAYIGLDALGFDVSATAVAALATLADIVVPRLVEAFKAKSRK